MVVDENVRDSNVYQSEAAEIGAKNYPYTEREETPENFTSESDVIESGVSHTLNEIEGGQI